MDSEELEKEAEEKTAQYMKEHTEKYNSENTKLETDNYNTGREYGYEDGYIAGAWSREKRILDLEREITELKAESDFYNKERGNYKALFIKTTFKNKKAKEIIKRLLETPRSVYGRDEDGENTSFFNPDYEELEKQAKQLLEGIEK